MWIFTNTGFISTVSNSVGTLNVRARDKSSLKNLASTFKVEIEHTPLADYPYRLSLGHDQFAKWIDSQVKAIDYNNFKSAVALTRGKGFASALSEVWSTMHRIEDSLARSTRPETARKGPEQYGD
ncbi:MAG: hypothetical protein EBY01_08355 [Actinobacteria bacterium]|nr:hypothetical protein [Actinomycetota bacterium]